MDSLQIELRESSWGTSAAFRISGRDLESLLPSHDDGWTLLPVRVLIDHPDHLRGGPDRWEDPVEPWYKHSAVLACGCGQPGCDAVLARVDYGRQEVVWHLISGKYRPIGVGPFTFRRGQYDAAFASLSRP